MSIEKQIEYLNRGIYIRDENGRTIINCFRPIPYILPGIHYIDWTGNIDLLKTSIFEKMMKLKGFTACYAMSEEDEFVQNSTDFESFKDRNLEIPKNTIKRDEFGNVFIDPIQNPGKDFVIGHTRLRSCWRMWFSDEYFEFISREKM